MSFNIIPTSFRANPKATSPWRNPKSFRIVSKAILFKRQGHSHWIAGSFRAYVEGILQPKSMSFRKEFKVNPRRNRGGIPRNLWMLFEQNSSSARVGRKIMLHKRLTHPEQTPQQSCADSKRIPNGFPTHSAPKARSFHAKS